MKNFFILLLILFLSGPVKGIAQTDRAEKKSILMDTVVVNAEKNESKIQTGDVDIEASPVNISLIKRDAFKGKFLSLAEVIEKETGVQIRQSGGLGSFSSISLRGSTSDQVMVFVDGILLNDASGGGVDLSNIALDDVQAIEIYQGITPINFSKASIGGVVNIKTLRPKQGINTSLNAGYSSFNTQKAAGFINHKLDKWDYLISADYLSSDNDYDILNNNGTEWNPLDDTWEQRKNAQVNQANILGKTGYNFTPDIRLDIANQYFTKDQGLPGWDNSALTSSCLDTTRNISTLRLKADDLNSLHFNTAAQVSYTWKKEEYDDRGGHIGLGEQDSTYITTRLSSDIFLEWLTDFHMLIFSANTCNEQYKSEDHLDKQNPIDSTRNTFSLGLQDSIFLFQEKVIVTPGIRYTWVKDELEGGTSIWDTALEGETLRDNYFSPQMGVKYKTFEWLTFKANIAKYSREPSLFELFGDRGFFIGNSDLKQENSINFDLGTQIQWNPEQNWLKAVSLNLTWFRNDSDDLIARVYDSRGIGRSVNISKALIQGIEAKASLDISKYFRMIFNATWQDPENQSQVTAFDGKNLPGRFEKSYLARGEARYKGIKLYLEYVRDEDMYYDTANLRKADDKNEINAGISFVYSNWLFSVEGKNLNDDLYEDFNSYPLPGRSFYTTIKYEF